MKIQCLDASKLVINQDFRPEIEKLFDLTVRHNLE